MASPYPGMTAKGGVLLGLPVLTSRNIPESETSNIDTSITLLDPSEGFIADDGGGDFGVSRQTSVQIETAPGSGAQAMVSLWQVSAAALRVERTVS